MKFVRALWQLTLSTAVATWHSSKACLLTLLSLLWQLTSSTTFTTRQTPSKLSLLSLLWQFCSYLFWPQRSPKAEG